MFSEVRKRVTKAGQAPGTPIYTGKYTNKETLITVIAYDPQHAKKMTGTKIEDCLTERKPGESIWVNVEGLNDIDTINQIAQRFNLHPLTVEDILNIEQRPKIEEFEGYIFVTLKVLHLKNDKKSIFSVKQISIIIGKDFVLSFQELDTTLFNSLETRLLSDPTQRLREQRSDYLAYRLIDIIVDQYFVVLEAIGDQIEIVEEHIISHPEPQNARTIYRLKRQILLLRKAIWPMREALSHLMHSETNLISKFTNLYLRDVYDHAVQAIDSVETFRDMLSSMLDMYLSSLTNRMNEVMKTLTIIATIFIPITAIASIYGMNFQYIPGLYEHWGFAAIFGLMIAVAVAMLIYFRKKKWI